MDKKNNVIARYKKKMKRHLINMHIFCSGQKIRLWITYNMFGWREEKRRNCVGLF